MEHYQPVLHGTNGTVPLLETDPPRLHYLWIATNAEVLTEYATKSRQREQAAESLRQTIQSRRDHPDEPFDHAHDERERRLLAAEQDIAVDYGKLLVHLVQKAGECLLKPQYAVLQPTGWTVGKPFPNSEAFIAELQRLHQEANDRFHELSRQPADDPSAAYGAHDPALAAGLLLRIKDVAAMFGRITQASDLRIDKATINDMTSMAARLGFKPPVSAMRTGDWRNEIVAYRLHPPVCGAPVNAVTHLAHVQDDSDEADGGWTKHAIAKCSADELKQVVDGWERVLNPPKPVSANVDPAVTLHPSVAQTEPEITQTAFATIAGVDIRTVRRWKQGNPDMPMTTGEATRRKKDARKTAQRDPDEALIGQRAAAIRDSRYGHNRT